MNKNSLPKVILSMFLTGLFLLSCSSDDDPAAPTISLSESNMDVIAEVNYSVDVSYTADATPSSISVTKYVDGVAMGTPNTLPATASEGTFPFSFMVDVDDSDAGIVKYNFTILDNDGQAAQTELVLNIELTKMQLLLKYDWLLTDEIRLKTGESDINPVYKDDVYRFNADGTYQKSIGALADDFSDAWYKHCEWDFDEVTGVLKLHRTGAFTDETYDVMTITEIDKNEFKANITYLNLDVFDPTYDPSEDYVKVMATQAKGNSFDPYLPGPDDDIEGPSTTPCNVSDFENN